MGTYLVTHNYGSNRFTEFAQRFTQFDHALLPCGIFPRSLVDTNRLRSRHDIAFAEADLAAQALPAQIPEADLILCNHVLEHIGGKGPALIQAMYRYLRPGGILSIGSDRRIYRERMLAHQCLSTLHLEALAAERNSNGVTIPFVFRKPLGL
jgi:SAM-dependent methyltransferase